MPSFLRRNNPYNPRYAMPGYVLKEPSRRAQVTPGLPYMWGRAPQAIVSPGLPRGTVDFNLPPDLAGVGSLSGTSFGDHPPFAGADPIAAFGRQAAREIIMRTGGRQAKIRAVLSRMGGGLTASFDGKVAGGMRVEGALGAALANRLLSRAATGQPGLGDVPPPPGTGATTTATTSAARLRTVDSSVNQVSSAPVVQWSPLAATIIAQYKAAFPSAYVSGGTRTGTSSANMSDKKAFHIYPVTLLGDKKAQWTSMSSSLSNPTRWAQVKNGTAFFYAKDGLLWYYNPDTKTLQIRSEGPNLFELAARGVEAVVDGLQSLLDKIAGMACSAVSSNLTATALVIGTGVSAGGATGAKVTDALAKARARCGGGGGGAAPPAQEDSGSGVMLMAAAGLAAVLLLGKH